MSAVVRAGRARGRTAPRWVPYAFLSPVIVLFSLFFLAPIGYTGYLSLRKVQVSGLGLGSGARREVFAGLDNYRDALSDGDLWASIGRVGAYGALVVPIMLGLALLFALLLDTPAARARSFSRISIFLPYAVPAVIASLLWGFLYLPSVSPFQYLLRSAGIGSIDLLGPDLILFSVANIAVWGGVGFNMMVIFTSLRSIPPEIYESARIDGCNERQIALRIKVPMVLPALIMTTVFSMIATLQVFSEPMTLRPLTNALATTWTPLMKVYRDAFTIGDLYSAAATSMVVASLTLVLSFGFLRLVRDNAGGGR